MLTLLEIFRILMQQDVIANVDTVVFDLGGVMIDLQPEVCEERFRALGFAQIDSFLGRYVQSGLFLDLECGFITAAEFFDLLRPLCPEAASDTEMQDAFNAFLRDVPVERLRAVHELKQRKRVIALSNTNQVMFNSWIAAKFRADGHTFRDYFTEALLSFEEGTCKPAPYIFDLLIRRFGLDPQRTLFIDDSEQNCEAARSCGLRALHLAEDMDLVKTIERIK